MLAGFFNNLRGHDRPSTRPNLKAMPAGLQTSGQEPSPTRGIEHPLDRPKPFPLSSIVNSLKDIRRFGHTQTLLQLEENAPMGHNRGGV